MNTLNSLKCAAILLPALAMGVPMANASDEKRTDPASPERATAVAGHHYLETMPVRGYHSDSLVGQEVKSRRSNESVGKVSNLLLDENDKIVAVVISVGGVLGIGEHDVAIAWDQVERRVDGDETTLWVNLTEESLKDAPKFSGETRQSRGEQQRSDRADQRADQRDAKPADQRTATVRTAEYVETKPARGYHSDNLIGQNVKSRSTSNTIGEVSNLVLDHDGQVVAVIISVGGLMGIGARDVAISWDQIERTFDDDEVTLWVNLTEESLKDAPKYSTETKRTSSRR